MEQSDPERLQVPTKSHPELFSPQTRADRQHLSFLCPQGEPWPGIEGGEMGRQVVRSPPQRRMLSSPLRLFQPLAPHPMRAPRSCQPSGFRPCLGRTTSPEIVRRQMRGPGKRRGCVRKSEGRSEPGVRGCPDPGAGGKERTLPSSITSPGPSPPPGIAPAGEPRLLCNRPALWGAARGADIPSPATREGKLRHDYRDKPVAAGLSPAA